MIFQIIPPHDVGIQSSVEQNLTPWGNAWVTDACKNNKLCTDPLADVLAKYMAELSKLPLDKYVFPQSNVYGVTFIIDFIKSFYVFSGL